MKKLLFITWDGPQTSYMEGLFLPIFKQMKNTAAIDFHVLQFTWADVNRTDSTKKVALSYGIHYTAVPISRKPIAFLGSLWSMYRGTAIIEKYIKQHQINVVMPRSTMPATMVNVIKNKKFQTIFDADGLPLEERVDFAGLSKTSAQYSFFKNQEKKMLQQAEVVLTRSHKAIAFHIANNVGLKPAKFTVVFNGRDVKQFQPNVKLREKFRKDLGFAELDTVFVYCGSLGPQYGWSQMIQIFEKHLQQNPKAKFLILTGNVAFAESQIPKAISYSIVVKSVPFQEVAAYLNVADIAFAIREPKESMQGVAPIKLGEYLLMGIPTIASAGIGDTDAILNQIPNCLVFDHQDHLAITKAVAFSLHLKSVDQEAIRKAGKQYFSLEESATSYLQAFQKLV